MTFFWRSILPLVLLTAVSGCVISDTPLSAPDPAGSDSRLLGTWIGDAPPQTNGVTWLHFSALKDGRIEALTVSPTPTRGHEAACYRFHTTAIGTDYYMNLKPHIPGSFQAPATEGRTSPEGYFFAKYSIDGEILRIWILTGLKPVTAAVQAGDLKGEIRPGGAMDPTRIRLTDTPENLARFFSTVNHAEMFTPFLICRKVNALPPRSE